MLPSRKQRITPSMSPDFCACRRCKGVGPRPRRALCVAGSRSSYARDMTYRHVLNEKQLVDLVNDVPSLNEEQARAVARRLQTPRFGSKG